MSRKFGVRAAILLIGFTAAIAQIVLMRELMVVFYGNEISIGLMLASWLIWTAAGSALAGRLPARSPRRIMAGTQVLLAAVLPATVLAVRTAKGFLQTVPGEMLGPGAMLLTSLAVLGPLCMLSGALFTAGSRVWTESSGSSGHSSSAREAAASVYLWEAAGSSAGGLLTGLLLVKIWGSLEIAGLLSLLNLLAACGLGIAGRRARSATIGMVALASAAVVFSGLPGRLEDASKRRFWNGQNLLATRNSVYGNLAVTAAEGSRTVYENGVVLFTAPDPEAAEEAVHYALLEHPEPRTLLLIGGGLNGSIAQALRHSTLQRVDYVELDPAVLDLGRDCLPNEWSLLENDPRVHAHVTDGRLFLKTAPIAFDVVIVNLPDPQNAQLNRFFTAEFFAEVSRKLTRSGVFSFQLRSSENYISPELGEFLAAIHQTLWTVFPEVTVIPGETVHFFAAQHTGILAASADELLARLRERNLKTAYVSEYFVPFRMTPDRVADMERHLQGPAAVNRDFAPVAYYFDVALWSSQFGRGYARMFRVLAGVSYGWLLAGVAILSAGFVAARRFVGQRPAFAAAACTAATGFTMLGLQVLLLLGFQAVCGYVYQQLAVIVAAFMAGMAVGSWIGLRAGMKNVNRRLGLVQVIVAAAPLAALSLFEIHRAVFPVAAAGSGILGGLQFSIASRVFFGATADHRRLGLLYALDLAGAAVGALVFSAWLVPVYGFFRAAIVPAMLSLAAAILSVPARAPARQA